ncbi:MAG: bacterial proteasome activator family protein [Mycobacteriales bacterium]
MSDESPVIVIGPDGQPVQLPDAASAEEAQNPVTQMVSEPDKVMRIGTMVKQLLDEVRQAPLDDASRKRLMEIHDRSITQLAEGLSPDLREELEAFTLPFSGEEVPSNDELRIAQAQLVGWLEGVFHGIQTALVAQQVAARAQIEQMRGRSLPAGMGQQPQQPGPGQYL